MTSFEKRSTTATGSAVSRRSGLRDDPRLTLVAVTLGVIMVGVDGTVVAVANPYIGRDLRASLADLQWVTNSYLLVIAVSLIFGGKLGDHFGRRRIFLIGVVGFALTSLCIGLVGTIDGVVVLRGAQGAFGACLLPNSLALLRTAYPEDELNRAIGIWVSATAIATAAGPIVGGLFVEHVSWQSVFFINVPIGAVALAIGMLVLRESRESVPQRFDVVGTLTLGLGLAAIVYGLIKAQSWGWMTSGTLTLIGLGLLLIGLFIAVEQRSAHPLLPLRIFRDRSVSVGTVVVLLDFFALFGVLFFVSLYLENVHGYSPVAAGLRLLPLTIAFAVSSPIGARLTDRFGPWLPITLGLTISSIGLFSFATLRVDSSYLHLWPPFVLLGLGIGFVVTAATDAIIGNTSEDDAGVAGGVQTTAIQLGGVLGTAVCGSILGRQVASVLSGDLTSSGVPASIAQQVAKAAADVSQGLAPVPAGDTGRMARAITEASHSAFMSGFHLVMLVAASVALVGAALGPFVRRGPASSDDTDRSHQHWL